MKALSRRDNQDGAMQKEGWSRRHRMQVFYLMVISFLCGFQFSQGPFKNVVFGDLERKTGSAAAAAAVVLQDLPTRLSAPTPAATLQSSNVSQLLQCDSKACMRQQGYEMGRVFPDRSADTTWKTSSFFGDQGHQGILLVKMPKAASSTSAGVALRIAHRNGGKKKIAVRYMHELASKMNYGYRHPQSSYLFTTVRDPDSRAMSRVFFTSVSHFRKDPSNDNIILTGLNTSHFQMGAISKGQGGYQLNYGALEEIPLYFHYQDSTPTRVLQLEKLLQRVQHTIDNYDFIIPTERLDEGLVAMTIRLGIPLENVLYASSKSAGSYYLLREPRKCIKTKKKFISPRIQQYLDSPEWQAKNYGDYVFHAAAHISLNLTIQAIGQERFDAAMKEFQQLKAQVNERCAHRIQFPCTENGKDQESISSKNCYYRDSGCGYPCIDEMIANQTLLAG